MNRDMMERDASLDTQSAVYICDRCANAIRVYDTDGDRELLEGWRFITDAQTGEHTKLFCPAHTLAIVYPPNTQPQ